MDWIFQYQLFLFDFDGLLVNTEELHFKAYQKMCIGRGFTLPWDFNRYCQAAHYDAHKLKESIYAELPQLKENEPDWNILYAEKKKAILQLLQEDAVHLMPGVGELLVALKKAEIKCCVVTHSPTELISTIRQKIPALNSIAHWITREHYTHPKPNSECYQKAIELHANATDKVIGFEDTPRGMEALLGTTVKPVLVCEAKYPEIPHFLKKGVVHFPSMHELMKNKSLP